jgi:hypothetical protein
MDTNDEAKTFTEDQVNYAGVEGGGGAPPAE